MGIKKFKILWQMSIKIDARCDKNNDNFCFQNFYSNLSFRDTKRTMKTFHTLLTTFCNSMLETVLSMACSWSLSGVCRLSDHLPFSLSPFLSLSIPSSLYLFPFLSLFLCLSLSLPLSFSLSQSVLLQRRVCLSFLSRSNKWSDVRHPVSISDRCCSCCCCCCCCCSAVVIVVKKMKQMRKIFWFWCWVCFFLPFFNKKVIFFSE